LPARTLFPWKDDYRRAVTILRIAPVLVVRDVVASVEFWHVRVGFETDKIHGDLPSFAMPARDGVTRHACGGSRRP
jgi:hypothetical protein